MRPARDIGQLGGRSMEGSEVFLPVGFFEFVSVGVEDFVEQDVASVACFHDFVGGSGVAGNDYFSVGRLKNISVGFFPDSVLHWKRSDRDISVAIDDSGSNLVNIDL